MKAEEPPYCMECCGFGEVWSKATPYIAGTSIRVMETCPKCNGSGKPDPPPNDTRRSE